MFMSKLHLEIPLKLSNLTQKGVLLLNRILFSLFRLSPIIGSC